MTNKLYAQLWSVNDFATKDFLGTLRQIAEMGYHGVEFAGYFDTPAKEMKNHLDELGLYAISSHVGIDNIKTNLEAEIEYLNTLGSKYLVCPGADISTVENAKIYADLFNKVGEKCKKSGLIFAYHNHDHEFKLDGGQYPLEVLFDNADPQLVKQQPDVYWVAYAGLDAVEYIKKNKDRCPIIHLKQIENYHTKANVDAGSGIIDFAKIMEIASQSDFVYEQERSSSGTSLSNMKKSFDYITREITR